MHAIIHSKIFKAPLQEIYSEAPPATAIQISLKQRVEHTFIILTQEANFQGKSIPCRGTNNGDSSAVAARGIKSWQRNEEE